MFVQGSIVAGPVNGSLEVRQVHKGAARPLRIPDVAQAHAWSAYEHFAHGTGRKRAHVVVHDKYSGGCNGAARRNYGRFKAFRGDTLPRDVYGAFRRSVAVVDSGAGACRAYLHDGFAIGHFAANAYVAHAFQGRNVLCGQNVENSSGEYGPTNVVAADVGFEAFRIQGYFGFRYNDRSGMQKATPDLHHGKDRM